jgi:16S rRNA G966 N2-methylase RsmD
MFPSYNNWCLQGVIMVSSNININTEDLDTSNLYYYTLLPDEILQDISTDKIHCRLVNIKNIQMLCNAHVYPSDRFRTTNFLLDSILPFLKNSRVCDMGCGPGVVGLYAYKHGAKKVVSVDINNSAVKNALLNKRLHNINDQKMSVFLSDCFDSVPLQKFDIIVFNLPFHSDPIKITNPLEYAFYDPNFSTLRKFLDQVIHFSVKNKTKIFLAFSNKGDVRTLENILRDSNFKWQLWKRINQDQKFDNRIYLLGYLDEYSKF